MWTRRFGFISLFLFASLIFLVLPQQRTEMQISAKAPDYKPSASSVTFLPFIANPDALASSRLWRFGIDKVRRPFSAYNSSDLSHLRAGWFIDFQAADNPEPTSGLEYVPMVRMKQLKSLPNGTSVYCCAGCSYAVPATYVLQPSLNVIQTIAAAHPGRMWIIGNEMERIDIAEANGTCAPQDEMLPEVYAQAYHDVYTALKAADPTAQAAFGPLVQPSPLRLKWVDRVWAEYTRRYGVTMPVDVWSVHIYAYNEQKGSQYWGADIPAGLSETSGTLRTIEDTKNFAIHAQLIVGWRTWMKDHGQQNKPLITPEYGANLPEWIENPPGVFPFTPDKVRDSFMYPSFDYFLNHTDASIGYPADGNRLVQRWAWWSLDYDDGQCVANKYNLINSGALFYSGLGSSSPPTTCPFPAQGIAPLGNYWTTYVHALPAGNAKPYAPAPVRAPVGPIQTASLAQSATTMADSAILQDAPESGFCSNSPEARSRFLQSLPSHNTPEGQQAWLRALTGLTAGTRICAP